MKMSKINLDFIFVKD